MTKQENIEAINKMIDEIWDIRAGLTRDSSVYRFLRIAADGLLSARIALQQTKED